MYMWLLLADVLGVLGVVMVDILCCGTPVLDGSRCG